MLKGQAGCCSDSWYEERENRCRETSQEAMATQSGLSCKNRSKGCEKQGEVNFCSAVISKMALYSHLVSSP